MATEEQLAGTWVVYFAGGTNWYRVGQRLPISNRVVSKLSFKTFRVGNCTGATLTFTVRKVSDDGIVATKLYGNVADVPLTEGWIEVTFDTPVYVNESVRIMMEWGGTLGNTSNYLKFYASVTGVKSGEEVTRYYTSYTTGETWDATYIYTYTLGIAPTVTTQAVTAITATTATGNGNITDLGSVNPTAHGVCWNTTGTPTTANSKTNNGAASATGAFTTAMTGLVSGTHYYVRAYATSPAGTSYGGEVNFIASSVKVGLVGCIWQETTKLHWIDENNAEQSKEGTLYYHDESHPKPHLWWENALTSQLQYIDEALANTRRLDGTATGVTGQPKGTIWIEGADLHGIDVDGEEVYIEGA